MYVYVFSVVFTQLRYSFLLSHQVTHVYTPAHIHTQTHTHFSLFHANTQTHTCVHTNTITPHTHTHKHTLADRKGYEDGAAKEVKSDTGSRAKGAHHAQA